MTITAIGFANKYYTLWHIEEETRPLGNGCNYVVTHYTYIKNISFDKETALAKYPNATLDESLRGKTTSWSSQPKEVWDNVNCYRFGRYKYEVIGLSDLTYLEWYWNQLEEGDHKDYVSSYLEGCGYEIRTNTYTDYYGETHTSQYLMSPEDLENEKIATNNRESAIQKAKNNEVVELFIESNPDFDGAIRIDNVFYFFEEVKENWYQGFEYYLPVLNGKAKRVKNKTILATLSYKNDKIYIINFSIKK